MKVYLLASFMAYEGFTLLGVYANKDALMEAARRFAKETSYHKDDLSWAVTTVGTDFDEMQYSIFEDGEL